MRHYKTALLLVLAATLFFAACTTNAQEPQEPEMAPDFSATTLSGEEVSMQGYLAEEKPTIIYFTASWCPVCAKNWPGLEQAYQTHGDQVNFLSISIDPTDTAEVLEPLAEENNLTYPMVEGNPDLMRAFGVSSQATTIGINPDGSIAFMHSMKAFSVEEYDELVSSLL